MPDNNDKNPRPSTIIAKGHFILPRKMININYILYIYFRSLTHFLEEIHCGKAERAFLLPG